MRTTSLISTAVVATLLFSAEADVGDAAARKEKVCWPTKQMGFYVSCFAKGKSEKGSLTEKKKECENLGEDCIAVVCEKNDQDCTVRHHKFCEGGEFLAASPNPQETTYVKSCATYNKLFDTEPGRKLPCRAPHLLKKGNLEERKFECANAGVQSCGGVTCRVDANTQVLSECYIQNFTVCGSSTQLEEDAGYKTFTMREDNCLVKEYPNSLFSCGQPKDEDHTMTYFEAHKKCLAHAQEVDSSGNHATTQSKFCNGVHCLSLDQSKADCALHYHCVKHRGELTISAGASDTGPISYHFTCNGGPFCVSECWTTYEMGQHRCLGNCDCDRTRICSTAEYCMDPPKEEKPPAPPVTNRSSHAGLYVLLVLFLLAVVAFLVYQNRQMAHNYTAPSHFQQVPTGEEDPNWVIDDVRENDEDIQ